MKRWMIAGILGGFLLLGVTGVWATADSDTVPVPSTPDRWTFEEMLPFMKNMHPNMGDNELKEMYEACPMGGEMGMMGEGMMMHGK